MNVSENVYWNIYSKTRQYKILLYYPEFVKPIRYPQSLGTYF